MNKISCKMKNSFAIDNNSILYSWGSHESGLLGREEEVDVHVPKIIELKNGHNSYLCDSVSSSNFHVAVIANRINPYNSDNINTKYAYQLFENLNEWYKNVFIKKLSSIESLIKMLLLYNDNSTDPIKYEDFEKNILMAFFNLQNFNKKGVYNLRTVYKEIFSSMVNISCYRMEFLIGDLVNLLNADSNFEMRELWNYLKYICDYFRNFPEDFGYYLLIILRYEKEIDDETAFNLFQYQNGTKLEIEKNDEKKLISKLINELKGFNNKLNTNLLIDQILKKQTGLGEVFTWGSYSECRLGYKNLNEENHQDNEIFFQYTPKLVKFPNPLTIIKSISCGYSHSLALSEEGIVYSWGSCKYGCLGNSHSVDNIFPVPIIFDFEEKPFKNILEISAGMHFSLALGSDKLAYSWGCGTSGRLGHGDEITVFSPKLIRYFKNFDIKISAISCGDTHCGVVTTANNVYSWGNGSFGKLGHVDNDDVKLPMFIEFFRDKLVDMIMCGSSNTIVKTTDKKIYGWGKNSDGMLGVINNSSDNIYVPHEIYIKQEDSLVFINNFSLGTMHSMFLGVEGSIYTCGRNINGNLGLNIDNQMVMNPLRIPKIHFFNKLNNDFRDMSLFKNYSPEFSLEIPNSKLPIGLMYIACSSTNTAFITNNNNLYISGDGSLIGETKKEISKEKSAESKLEKYKIIPIRIKHDLLVGKVTHVAIGANHVVCIADKKAYSWGHNVSGVLGLESVGINVKVDKPCLITKILSQMKMASVSDTHTMLLTSTGEIYSCGYNLYGKLGLGEPRFNETLNGEIQIQYELEPKLVIGVSSAVYIACSNHHSACIAKSSSISKQAYWLYSWGGGYGGKLGRLDGKDSNSPKMVEIPDYNNDDPLHFVQVALGSEFSIALDTTGSIWGWGRINYLGLNRKDEGVYITPKLIHTDHKFKYVNCSSSYTLALDIFGNIYGWGKSFSINNKCEFLSIHKKDCDVSEIVSAGINHFGAIDSSTLSAYTWGNNLFNKCGQTFAKPGEVEYSYNQQFPKKIQYFYDKFLKNKVELKMEVLIHKENKNNEIKDKIANNELQSNLLDEPIEAKDFGIYFEDYKINLKFYEVLKEYFESMKIISEMKSKKQIETENSIISLINNTKCKKMNEFISEIPKIISKNFQLYEAFFSILQNHPCFFLKVKNLVNKNIFLDLVKNSFGGDGIPLKNKRTILALTGLWNSIFKEESREDYPHTLKDSDNYEDFITYDLYHLIFNLDDDNKNVVYDLIAELFIIFIHEILKNSKDFVDPTKDKDILSLYKDLPGMRKELFVKIVTATTKYIKNLFSDLREKSRNKFSFSVLFILKRISKLFPIKQKLLQQTNIENHCKIFNCFLFTPFLEFLRKIKEGHSNNNSETKCKESQIISKRIPYVLEKAKKKGDYTELYNLYISYRKVLETKYFSVICSSTSDVLSFLFDIIESMSKNEKFQFTNKLILDMNESCSSSLNLYKKDFTLIALKDFLQSKIVDEHETIPISIRIKDLIQIEQNFCYVNDSKGKEKVENNNESHRVFNVIINQLSNIKISEELKNGSSINNLILNLYLKPNLFFFHSDSVNVIKCQNCFLPIHSVFFANDYVEKCIYGKDWKCFYCEASNRREALKCLNCKKLKFKTKNSNTISIFKNYVAPRDGELTQLYENVLYNIPILNEGDNIVSEIKKEKERLENQKESTEENSKKIEIYVNFLEAFKKIIGYSVGNNKYIALEKLKIKEMNDKVKKTFDKRKRHLSFLSEIKEFINNISSNGQNAKHNYLQTENQTNLLIKNIKKGYANLFAMDRVPTYLQKYLSNEVNSNKSNTIRRFRCTSLIKRKIIDEILFNNQRQDSLIQKSSIVFEKDEDGYVIKLNYKELSSKFVICGQMTNEYIINKNLLSNNHILEMRKTARHNPTWNCNEVRFNVFYLIKLINQLETE